MKTPLKLVLEPLVMGIYLDFYLSLNKQTRNDPFGSGETTLKRPFLIIAYENFNYRRQGNHW